MVLLVAVIEHIGAIVGERAIIHQSRREKETVEAITNRIRRLFPRLSLRQPLLHTNHGIE